MRWKGAAAALFTLAALAAGHAYDPVRPAYAACDPGDKIDKSTAAEAAKKIEAAGYSHVGGLQKGCDNFWHGTAMKGGASVYVALSPTGEVYQEQD